MHTVFITKSKERREVVHGQVQVIDSVQRNSKIVTSYQMIKIINGLNYSLFVVVFVSFNYSLELCFNKKPQYLPV